MTEAQKISALKQVCDAVIDAVKTAGELGAPSGSVYAALMAFGCKIEQYEMLIDILIKAGKLRKQGNLLFAVE